uniref:Tyrosine-protein kinase ephrin type A/B receptor-like domain-containing protein n=1 Tax=Tetradesmus obliquus TaxID=3088 RepID=A0A383W0D1_TETOB|eukprot:jgi/Sobl393_1/16075/SZX71145.1
MPRSQLSSPAACFVPPGWKLAGPGSSQIERCPKGQYKEGFTAAGDSVSLRCRKCPQGSSTITLAGSRKRDCKVLLPGWYWAAPSKRQASAAVEPAQTTELIPRLCPQNSWCPGGLINATTAATPCPKNLWTEGIGATSDTECRVPPGHYLADDGASAAVQKCPNGDPAAGTPGTYQPDWLDSNDTKAIACVSCGSGILSANSEPLSLYGPDNDGTGSPTYFNVAASSFSCYIRQGQGMVLEEAAGFTPDSPVFKAVTCNSNSYGAAATVYGLEELPCEDCLEGMITADAYKNNDTGGYYDANACLVPPGYGFCGTEMVPCLKGEYNEGLDSPGEVCKPCSPQGLTTPGSAIAWASSSNCSCVLPGYAYDSQQAVSRCPVGSYSDAERCFDQAASWPCTPCPNGLLTRRKGAASIDLCSVCPAGSGIGDNTVVPSGGSGASCNPCASGYFGSVNRADGSTACRACPAQTPFLFPYNGDVNAYLPVSISTDGAVNEDGCLPDFTATEDGTWMLPSRNLVNVTAIAASVNTLSRCVDACKQTGAVTSCENCQFVSFDYKRKVCFVRQAADPSTASTRIAFKVDSGEQPQQTLGLGQQRAARRSAVGVQGSGTGLYSWWRDSSASLVGLNMRVDVTSPSVESCLQACTDRVECTAVTFLVDASAAVSGCSLRKGANPPGSSWRTLVRTRLTQVDAM